MKQRLILSVGAVVLGLGALGTSYGGGGDAAAGKTKAQTCLGCHGIASYNNVYPTYHVPKLGGQHADYIVAALKAYQSGERQHRTMHAQASELSAQDMADIAAYFSSFKGK
jgi:cytochrome c553